MTQTSPFISALTGDKPKKHWKNMGRYYDELNSLFGQK
jgi:hypothetical protein